MRTYKTPPYDGYYYYHYNTVKRVRRMFVYAEAIKHRSPSRGPTNFVRAARTISLFAVSTLLTASPSSYVIRDDNNIIIHNIILYTRAAVAPPAVNRFRFSPAAETNRARGHTHSVCRGIILRIFLSSLFITRTSVIANRSDFLPRGPPK